MLMAGSLVLTLVFVLLRAFGQVDWSWWIVFSPLLVFVALVVAAVASVGGLAYWIIRR